MNKEPRSPAFATGDRIFLGEGLFETLKVDHSKPRFTYLHWQRLCHSAAILGISFDLSFEDWQASLVRQIKQDALKDGGIKAILSGGVAPRGLIERGQQGQLVLQSFPYTVPEEPLRLITASWVRDPANPIYHVKSINYLEAIYARRHALQCHADDVLFFNIHQHATETSCANVFLIKNNSLYTPLLADGVLPGITRQRILGLSAQYSISYVETSVTTQMIEEADVVFTTNSLQGIRPVLSLDGLNFKVTHPLLETLNSLLKEEKD